MTTHNEQTAAHAHATRVEHRTRQLRYLCLHTCAEVERKEQTRGVDAVASVDQNHPACQRTTKPNEQHKQNSAQHTAAIVSNESEQPHRPAKQRGQVVQQRDEFVVFRRWGRHLARKIKESSFSQWQNAVKPIKCSRDAAVRGFDQGLTRTTMS